jgi:hypothetical protein
MQTVESRASAWSALKKTKVATNAGGGRVVATNQRIEAAREWHAAGECRRRRNRGVVAVA